MLDNLLYYVGIIAVFVLLYSFFRLLREYERGVFFSLGRYQGTKGPGLMMVIPFMQQMIRVDLRTIVMDIPNQDVISRDNVLIKVNAIVYFRIVEPDKAIIQVEDYRQATSQLAQTTLRSVLGRHALDEILSERNQLNTDIQQLLAKQTDVWGIKVTNVEIKHIDLGETMIRAMTRQAEAERECRAKMTHATNELQTAEKLVQAANALAKQPQALQLHYLQTISDIASTDKSHTVIFPLPIDLLLPFQRKLIQSVAATKKPVQPTVTTSSPEPVAPILSQPELKPIPKKTIADIKKKRKFAVYAGFR